jgi:hypothetical protein
MSVPNSAHLIHDFWTTVHQAIEVEAPGGAPPSAQSCR